MSTLPELEEAVSSLAPDDLAAFRAWFFTYCNSGYATTRFDTVTRTPADYEDFDPEAYDDETEMLDAWVHDRWQDDLRNLQSEADAEKGEARAKGPSVYAICRELFEEQSPRPGYGSAPEAVAEWEWRELEFLYVRTENHAALTRHRLERGAFIERKTRVQRDAQAFTDALFGPLKALPPRTDDDREPWPPDDGDDVGPWLLFDVMEPEELEEEMRQRETPAYARADDLKAALLGWWMSLPRDAYDLASPAHDVAGQFASAVALAASGSIRPATVGSRLLGLKRALPLAQDALGLLDALQGYPWLTYPAHTRLKALIEATRDEALDHYLYVRAAYEDLKACALQKLGGTKDDD